MSTTVLVETKIPGQTPPAAFQISLQSEQITVRDLLREYVTHQVEQHNCQQKTRSANFESEDEMILNNKVRKPVGQLQCNVECERAYKAFESNQLVVLINKYQPSELDETVTVTADSKVTFLRLVPLVGG